MRQELMSNPALQPARYAVPPLATGNGLRPIFAGSYHQASARG